MQLTSPRALLSALAAAAVTLALLSAPAAQAVDRADPAVERLALVRAAHADAGVAAPGGVEAQQDAQGCFDDPEADVVDEETEDPVTTSTAGRADLVEHCASYVDGLVLSAQVAAPSNPHTDVNWRRATFVGWFLDTTGDGAGDFFASYHLNADEDLITEVQRIEEDEESAVTCGAVTAAYDGETYTAGPIQPDCLDGATSVQVSTAMFYNRGGEPGEVLRDTAPDAGGFTSAFERSTDCADALPAPFADRAQIAEVHRSAVDCLYARGITLGTIVDNIRVFEPSSDITRAQFAGFTFRGLLEAGATLPDAQTPRFQDVPEGHTFDEEIHRLAAAEVLLGVTPTQFEPGMAIRRDQTASVLLRSLEHARGESITAAQPGTHFSDIDDSFHDDNIDAAFEQGLVEGIVAPNGVLGLYAPFQNTSRQQMASVVNRFVETVESS